MYTWGRKQGCRLSLDYTYKGMRGGWVGEALSGAQGLHGEASLLPFEADRIEDPPDRVALRTRVRLYRSPLTLERVMSLEKGKPCLFIHERLENESTGEF